MLVRVSQFHTVPEKCTDHREIRPLALVVAQTSQQPTPAGPLPLEISPSAQQEVHSLHELHCRVVCSPHWGREEGPGGLDDSAVLLGCRVPDRSLICFV